MCGMYSRFSPVAVGEEGSIVMPLLLRTVSSLCIAVDSIVNCCEERTSGTAWRTRWRNVDTPGEKKQRRIDQKQKQKSKQKKSKSKRKWGVSECHDGGEWLIRKMTHFNFACNEKFSPSNVIPLLACSCSRPVACPKFSITCAAASTSSDVDKWSDASVTWSARRGRQPWKLFLPKVKSKRY